MVVKVMMLPTVLRKRRIFMAALEMTVVRMFLVVFLGVLFVSLMVVQLQQFQERLPHLLLLLVLHLLL
jgi:hypothetical protein